MVQNFCTSILLKQSNTHVLKSYVTPNMPALNNDNNHLRL
jgi:hypothetical protein